MEVRKSSRLMIVDECGRLLLFLYRDEHSEPFWATVGGELINSEDYRDAAKRELYEETGLKLVSIPRLGPPGSSPLLTA